MELLKESISPPSYHDICVDSSCTDSHSGPSSSCLHRQEQPEATKEAGPKHSPKKPKATKLLIGTSILRDVRPAGLESTGVISIGGATNDRRENELKTKNLHHYKTVIVQCSTIDKSEPTEYHEGVSSLIQTVKQKAPNIRLILLTLCPRSDRQHNKVPTYNRVLQEVAEEQNIQLIQIQYSFLNSDGSLNRSHCMKDGLHLSFRGTSVLLKVVNKQFPILPSPLTQTQNRVENGAASNEQDRSYVNRRSVNRRGVKMHMQQHYQTHGTDQPRGETHHHTSVRPRLHRTNNNRNNSSRYERGNSNMHYGRQTSTRNIIRCHYCGEEGHVKSVCSHG